MRWLLAILLLVSLAWGTTYRQLSLEDMLGATDIAFYGRVLETSTTELEGEPWTEVTFEVLEPLKGIPEDDQTTRLTFYGGTLPDGTILSVNLMPEFREAELLLILAYDAGYYSPVVGFRQGLWRETPRGFVAETGQVLSLEEGELVLDGVGADRSDLLTVLKNRLEAQP